MLFLFRNAGVAAGQIDGAALEQRDGLRGIAVVLHGEAFRAIAVAVDVADLQRAAQTGAGDVVDHRDLIRIAGAAVAGHAPDRDRRVGDFLAAAAGRGAGRVFFDVRAVRLAPARADPARVHGE